MRALDKILIILAAVSILSAVIVAADPFGTDQVIAGTSTRATDPGAPSTTVNAQAGNVTELLINGTAITTSWQGYYGNVTGSIILADSSGNNFYDWNVSEPSGEVYASRANSITWANVNCSDSDNITAEETYLGQVASDVDSVSNTYSVTSHPDFYLGTVNISGCSSTKAYDSTGGQGTGFWQAILTESGDDSIIYTTILDSTVQTGFNGRDWQFELLVGENGKSGANATTLTPYYFFMELE